MADIEPVIEVLETRLLRAWMMRDERELKALISGDFLMMVGTTPPALLDRASFLGGMGETFALRGYRIQEFTARKHGRTMWFSGHVELELQAGPQDWKGAFLLTDMWRKSPVRRRWLLAERSLAPLKDGANLFNTIRSMQLWR